jgi:hypothetical protein
MTPQLRIAMLALAILFLFVVMRFVSRGRLQLKYALMWLVFAILVIIAAVFPDVVGFFSYLLGFHLSSNMVLLAGLVAALALCFSLTVIVSWQSRDLRTLVSRVSLLEKELYGDDAHSAEPDGYEENADASDAGPSGQDD